MSNHDISRLTLTKEGLDFVRQWFDSNDYIIAYTSGSTGEPKEIRLSKHDMQISARATNRFFNITPSSLLVCPLSATYIAGKMMIVRALSAGCRLIMESPSNLPLQSHYGKIDLLPIVPSQIEGLLKSDYLADIQNIIIGGAPLSLAQEQLMLSTDAAKFLSFATFGMTETCSHVALRPLGQPEYEALPGISFSVTADSRLIIHAEDFSFKQLETNDIIELSDGNHFKWLGRADNVVISGGIKLFPETIERKLAEFIPLDFYLAGEPDEKWGQRLVMYAELPENENTDNHSFQMMMAQTIKNILHLKLDKFEIPKRLYFLDHLPRTANGKLKRHQ